MRFAALHPAIFLSVFLILIEYLTGQCSAKNPPQMRGWSSIPFSSIYLIELLEAKQAKKFTFLPCFALCLVACIRSDLINSLTTPVDIIIQKYNKNGIDIDIDRAPAITFEGYFEDER